LHSDCFRPQTEIDIAVGMSVGGIKSAKPLKDIRWDQNQVSIECVDRYQCPDKLWLSECKGPHTPDAHKSGITYLTGGRFAECPYKYAVVKIAKCSEKFSEVIV